jgi:hypothetical protein
MSGSSDVPSNATAKTQRPAEGGALADAPGGVDRRRAPRVRSQSFLDGATQASSAFLGSTVDLSIGGCLVLTYESLEPGAGVTLTLKLPEGDLKTPAKVVHVKEDAIGCRLCGVQFEPLASESQALLARHLSRFGVKAASPGSATVKWKRSKADAPTARIVVEGVVHPPD